MATITHAAYPAPPPAYYPQPAPQTTVVLTQPGIAQPRPFGSCGYCGGFMREQFTVVGVLLAIICFPIGVICCLMMREKRCVSCGH